MSEGERGAVVRFDSGFVVGDCFVPRNDSGGSCEFSFTFL